MLWLSRLKRLTLVQVLMLAIWSAGALLAIAVLWVRLDAAHVFTPHHFCSAIYAETGRDEDLQRSDVSCWAEINLWPDLRVVGRTLQLPGILVEPSTRAIRAPGAVGASQALEPQYRVLAASICREVAPFVRETPEAMRVVTLWVSPGSSGTAMASPGVFSFSPGREAWHRTDGSVFTASADDDARWRFEGLTLHLTAVQLSTLMGCEP